MNNDTRYLERRPRPFGSPFVILLAGMLVSATSAEAQEWRLEPELRVGGEYDDNARLRSDPAAIQEIDGYILEGAMGIGYNTQRSGLKITPRLRSRVYNEVPDVDSNDQFLDFDYNYEGLKSVFGIDGSYQRESVRTAERSQSDVGTDDPDDIPTDDTGLVFSNAKRTRLTISPNWSHELTERLSIGAKYTYADVSYENAAATFLQDYTDQRVEGSLARKFTERTQGYIGIRGRRFEKDIGDQTIDGVGAVIGFQSDLSQTTRLQAEVGYENTDNSDSNGTDSNLVGNLNIVRRLETITLLAQYRRDVTAGGSGRLTARDTLNFNVKKQFTERFYGGFAARAYKTDGLGELAVTFEERDQREVAVQFGFALSRALSLEAEYSYTEVDRSQTEGTADSNNVLLWLVYRPTPIIN